MIVMLFLFDWRFGLICLVPVILGFASMFKMAGPKMADDMKNYQNALADMNNEAVEYVRGVPVVKTFGQTVHTFKRFKGSIDSYYKFCIAYCKKCRMPMLMYTVFINSAFAFLITLALILAGGEAVTHSVLLSFIFYVIFTPVIATSMTKILYMSENGMVVNDALTRVHSILDMKPLPDAEKSESPRDNSVEFKNVSFRYSGAETDAIRNVSFKVGAGETVALVGPSGGGKTTAAGLISRFWDVTGGEIKVGGVNVKNIRKSELMETVSYVFQDSRLLKTSILENVRLAKPNASSGEVENALHKAQCDDIIAKLPDGIDTVIGTKGVYLSGGEQQRIATPGCGRAHAGRGQRGLLPRAPAAHGSGPRLPFSGHGGSRGRRGTALGARRPHGPGRAGRALSYSCEPALFRGVRLCRGLSARGRSHRGAHLHP